MDLARIVGTVVATRKDPPLEGLRLALVVALDARLQPVGEPAVAVDALNLAEGSIVYLVRSGDAAFAHFGDANLPVDCAVAGLVDSVPTLATKP